MTSKEQPAPQRHLVMVWNPSYTDDAIDEHLKVLLDFVKRFEQHNALEDEIYVWWGKVRSANRQQPLARSDDVRVLASELGRVDPPEVHLYLTDYRSLYVAEMASIGLGDLPAAESKHAPSYYAREGLSCDFWCKLLDIRRLVLDDTLAVIEELKLLRNVHYNDRPVSLYGGMVDLPLIVVRPDDQSFFDESERESVTGDRLWAEYDFERGSRQGELERDLRDNLFGETVWNSFERATRDAILSAEEQFRDGRNAPAFDFAPVIGNLSKALECQVNATIRSALRRVPLKDRTVNLDGRSVDLLGRGALTLGELIVVLTKQPQLSGAMRSMLNDSAWFTSTLPMIIEAFRPLRNDAVHATRVDRAAATLWRNQFMGVGCEGHLARLAKVRPT